MLAEEIPWEGLIEQSFTSCNQCFMVTLLTKLRFFLKKSSNLKNKKQKLFKYYFERKI